MTSAVPWPTIGDRSKEVTYAAVGFAISCWEELEIELCALYAVFVGQPRASTGAIKGNSKG